MSSDEATHRVVATAGHVDHGKSTLLEALTGTFPDRLEEERRRGLTIVLGHVWATLRDEHGPMEIAFVDVPGHDRFIDTTIAGAGPAPAALFVVAADDGWSAQTSEHRDVLELLQVPVAVTAITKAGVADPARVAAVREEIAASAAGTVVAAAPVVVTDALTGHGLDALRTTLVQRLRAQAVAPDDGVPRLWVDRAFAAQGAGTVVTGTLRDGPLQDGAELRLAPADLPVRVRELQALQRRVEVAAPGTRVAVNLAGVAHTDVARGDLLTVDPWAATTTVDAWVRPLPGARLDRRGAWRLHVGTTAVDVRVVPTLGPLEDGEPGAVRLLLERPLPLVAGDPFVLREAGRWRTVAGGTVVDPLPTVRPRGASDRTRRARAVGAVAAHAAGAEVDARRGHRLEGLVALGSAAGDHRRLRAAAGWPPTAPLPDRLLRLGDRIVRTAAADRWARAVADLPPGAHARDALAARLEAAGAPAEVASPLLDHLVSVGTLERVRGGLARPGSAAAAEAAHRTRRAAVLADLDRDPFSPPPLDEVARRHGLDHRERTMLAASNDLVRCGEVTFTRVAVERAVARLHQLQERDGPFTAAQARDALATTRRFAVPLLEHLRRTGRTRFDGTHHRLLADGGPSGGPQTPER